MTSTSKSADSAAHFHFVTGRLAEHGLKKVVQRLAESVGFSYSIDVMPITVAALLTPNWIAKRINVPPEATAIFLPGYCDGDLSPLMEVTDVPLRIGPRDYRALPEMFGQSANREGYGAHSIEIIAEINHAPRQPLDEIIRQAKLLAKDGADVIDIGCDPNFVWNEIADCVRAVCDLGLRVSVDSLNPLEIEPAVRAGAELVLSVNASNRHAAPDWGCEVVVIPDEFETLGGLDETVELLANAKVPLRVDPILEPIGCGFASSLQRYAEVRRRYPDVDMMMGIGNLTELTDVDSAGINVLLLGYCEELRINSVLTTQVINWARSSVKECDLGRRLVHYAVQNQTIPKHLEHDLVLLRDPKLYPQNEESLQQLGQQLKDHNYRLFAENGVMHLINANVHLKDTDPFDLFAQLMATQPKNLDASHAFYLGYELSKALTALTLSKQYRQDESLDWGFLTRPETSHRAKREQAPEDR